MNESRLFVLALMIASVIQCKPARAHDGPDPIAYWEFEPAAVEPDPSVMKARLGEDARVLDREGQQNQSAARFGNLGIIQPGGKSGFEIPHEAPFDASPWLPQRALTVATWVSIAEHEKWGGLIGVIQDNGDDETGWILGYDTSTFYFALRGRDGTNRLTYLRGKTPYELGKPYHVAAVYDGKTMQLYVNGKLDATSDEQSGDIHYPDEGYVMLGAYRDIDEFYGLHGQLRSIRLYDLAAKPAWIEHDFGHDQQLVDLPITLPSAPLEFTVQPYLQFATQTEMTVMWRTSRPCKAILAYGETAQCESEIRWEEDSPIGEVKLTGLSPQTQYFYKVSLVDHTSAENIATPIVSPLGIFQTAVRTETPFAFAVISDTQGNPAVSGKLAEFAWGQRPNFLLHPGDLVSTGSNDRHWTDHFFSSMKGLIRNVPFFPVLGNHEQNARNYFDYVALPAPEYFYTFHFGNTQFFMIDSNRKVSPDSEQYLWLDKELSKSEATWKIVCYHHPAYSADENDYGDLWKTNQSTRGDMRVRELVPLMEARGVDVVWNGHIHSYERTWPIKNDRAVEKGAPIYMITGGGGGHLETAGPVRPFFTNTVRRGHHYCMVRVNGGTMEIQAYDLEDRLFDQVVLEKEPPSPRDESDRE